MYGQLKTMNTYDIPSFQHDIFLLFTPYNRRNGFSENESPFYKNEIIEDDQFSPSDETYRTMEENLRLKPS